MQFLWELHEVMHMKLLTQSLPSDWYILSVIIIPSVVFLLKDHIIALLLLEYFAVFFFFKWFETFSRHYASEGCGALWGQTWIYGLWNVALGINKCI